MTSQPHADSTPADRPSPSLRCAALTISDTRGVEDDRSGQLVDTLLTKAGHRITYYAILPDEPSQIGAEIDRLCGLPAADRPQIIILNGGTGIAARDTTYEAIADRLDKTLPGFGELFRWLSYQEIGSRAMASRAIAGTRGQIQIFSLPGSTAAVRLALEALILPEIVHLAQLLGAI